MGNDAARQEVRRLSATDAKKALLAKDTSKLLDNGFGDLQAGLTILVGTGDKAKELTESLTAVKSIHPPCVEAFFSSMKNLHGAILDLQLQPLICATE